MQRHPSPFVRAGRGLSPGLLLLWCPGYPHCRPARPVLHHHPDTESNDCPAHGHGSGSGLPELLAPEPAVLQRGNRFSGHHLSADDNHTKGDQCGVPGA